MSDTPGEQTSITITVRSEPFHGEPEGAKEFFEAVGRLTFLWGRFEVHFSSELIQIIQMLFELGEAHEVPISWKRRVKLWRRGFDHIPELAKFRPQAISYIERVMDISKRRNALLHGSWNGFNPGLPLTAKMTSIRPGAETSKLFFDMPSHNVTLADLLEMQRLADNLNTQLLGFGWAISERFHAQFPPPQPPTSTA